MPEKLLNYDLLGTLGQGAGSTIYRARDSQTGRMVALKHVKRVKPKDLRFVEQMEAEFEVSKNFTHKNLRRSFSLKVQKSMLVKVTEAFLVMEYVDARPLEKGLPADLGEVIQTFVDAAEGLAAMHKMGWAHCDIKPNNILRSDDGQVKVIDFGQSCRIGTVKQRIQGTPDYIAPEQVERLPISESTDVFNLGATLYWALTGKHVPTTYHAKRAGENSFVLDALFKSPRELNREVPQVVSDVVMQCVLTNPRKRPQTMEELSHKLNLGRHILDRDRGGTSSAADEIDDSEVFDDTRF
jgi:serine/threonine-protein kinase